MQHLQYGNYDIRYMVYVRKMADIKTYIVPALKKDHKKIAKHEQKMLSFLANEMHKAGRQTEAHVVRIIVKPYLQQARKKWTEMTAMQKFKTVM